MTVERETLTDLVSAALGPGGLTFQAFQARAVDPDSGYRPSTGLIQKIRDGSLVKINPSLVRAIAAGLGRSSREVGIAAHRQYIGTPLETSDIYPDQHPPEVNIGVTGVPGIDAANTPLTLEVLEKYLALREQRLAERDSPEGDDAAEA
ncbi:hypothetical protein [Streptodolium elevatio]|uniref:Uncharacterized protein n=1 Tax=Streptodolium elevatio TaxID=3157996 RepID=A0ABV3DJU5_9ACTN